MGRQAATKCGLQRRLSDAKLDRLTDPRDSRLIEHPLKAIATTVVTAMVTDAPGLRGAESRAEQIAQKHPGWQGITQRIPDNVIGGVLRRIAPKDAVACLHRLNKAEARRGNRDPVGIGVRAVAVDGKSTATLYWYDLCRLARVDKDTATAEEVKEIFGEKHPEVQICIPKDRPAYGLVRCHTVTIVSTDAAYCLHVRNIPGDTNEIGALPDTLRETHRAYGRTNLIEVVTTDAGNSSCETGIQIVDEFRWDYFSQIKVEHGLIYDATVNVLNGTTSVNVEAIQETEKRDGKGITYIMRRCVLPKPGWFSWPHVRQLIRVTRQVTNPETGEIISIGDRYYLCSRSDDAMSEQDCLRLSRIHWRCENENHWTADAVLREDVRKLRWSRHPVGIIVVAMLRQLAIAILAMARSLSRASTHAGKPTWRQVIESFTLRMCASTLQMEAFDACPA